MPRISNEKSETPKTPERVFTDAELSKFHDDLQPFKVDNHIDFTAYHISKSTIKDRNTVIFLRDEFGEYIRPSRYERLENKINQYILWLGRKEYGRKMETERLQKLAESMGQF